MTKSIKLPINNGNSKTFVVEDAAAAKFFWSDYFTQSFEENNDPFVLENSFDLMGNPLAKNNSTKESIKLLSKK